MPDCTNASVVTIGTVNAMTGQTIHYTYDPLYRLTSADYTDGRYFHYSYDAAGNRLSQESKSDPGGNPASSTYTYDQANRLTSVNGVNYSWDDNGDLLSDGTSSYEYDAFSHLTKVVDGSDTYEFSYDEQGNRVGQAVNGNWTYYDLDLNAGLTTVLTAQDEDYLYGLGSTPLAQNDPGDIDYLMMDGLGSVRQVVRGDSYGQVTLTRSYDPFGNLLSRVGNGASAFGFAGQWQDGSGLMNMRARYYEPSDGRFLTQDSWTGDQEQPMSYNSWLYVYANPINNTDSSGNRCLTGECLGPEVTWKGMSESELESYSQQQSDGTACGPFALAMAANLLKRNPNYWKGAVVENLLESLGDKPALFGIPAYFFETSVSDIIPSAHVEYHMDLTEDDLIQRLRGGTLSIVTVQWQTDKDIEDLLWESCSDFSKYFHQITVGHYMVLVGYDPRTDQFEFLDPGNANKVLTYWKSDEFFVNWERGNTFIPAGSVTTIN